MYRMSNCQDQANFFYVKVFNIEEKLKSAQPLTNMPQYANWFLRITTNLGLRPNSRNLLEIVTEPSLLETIFCITSCVIKSID